jgi:hypothetical protein
VPGNNQEAQVIGIELPEVPAYEVVLPTGIYLSDIGWAFNNTIDEGGGDTYRGLQFRFFAVDSEWSGPSPSDLIVADEKPAGGWDEAATGLRKIPMPFFMLHTPTRLQVYVESSSETPVEFTLPFKVVRVGSV